VLTERFKTLTPAELPLLTRYTESWDRRCFLLTQLVEHGWTAGGSRPGMVVEMPFATALINTEREMRQMERVLVRPHHLNLWN